MGRPKLLLPWGGSTVIERLLEVLDHPQIALRCVVVRSDDDALAECVSRAGAFALRPRLDPVDMKASVVAAIQEIQSRFDPQPADGWLLIPADHPCLDRGLLEELLSHWQETRSDILLPRHGERRGHPALFRWSLAKEVGSIPDDCGLNWLIQKNGDRVTEHLAHESRSFIDLDTPEDYERHRPSPL